MSARTRAATTSDERQSAKDAMSSQARSVLELLGAEAQNAGLSLAVLDTSSRAPLSTRLRSTPFLMAPMAGVTNAAWRLLAYAGGAPLAYSEMVSVAGLHYKSAKTWDLVEPHPAEPPLAVQLFGSLPELFQEAVELVASRLGPKLALIDVNMACPVPKVTRKGEGSALLEDPPRAVAIIAACQRGLKQAGSNVAVTAKIRLGLKPDAFVAPEVAKVLEDAGICALGVHGRYGSELYRGVSRDSAIAQVVQAVEIPIIGSGDVFSAKRAVELKENTGCAAVFIARGSYGNPWIFGDARCALYHIPPPYHPLSEHMDAWRLHLQLLAATGERLVRARSFSCAYCKGLPHAALWRARVMDCESKEDFLALVDAVELASQAQECEVSGEWGS